jgi:hypothetical protein
MSWFSFRRHVRRLTLWTYMAHHHGARLMQVTQIGPINAGAAPVHYEIGDQNGVIQLPAGISVTLDPGLSGVVVTQDATGWFFSAPSSMPGVGPLNVTFTDTSSATGGTPVTASFPCTVNAESVTGLTLFQQ